MGYQDREFDYLKKMNASSLISACGSGVGVVSVTTTLSNTSVVSSSST